MKMPNTQVSVEYTKFVGGLDQESPALVFPPGAMYAAKNYLPASEGGYRRIGGYERFSGQSAPSDATYRYLTVTFSATITVGNTITGAVSGATGVVAAFTATTITVTKITGTFEVEAFSVGGTPKGTITAVTVGTDSVYTDAVALADAANIYRTDIAKPAGSAAIRGLGILRGTLYCFVDNSGGTAGEIYKATSSGWTLVPLMHEISFDTGIGTISDGDTITQLTSGATAVVSRAILESGAWDSDAVGRLIITTITGTFDATHALQVGGATKATASSLATAITITVGGRYEFIETNFSGSVDNKRLYGCDGVNRGFEFDGVTYAPINTGASIDKPEHVYAHKQHLFFSIKSSSINSSLGRPFEYQAGSGSSEIATGDNISGYMGLPGQALGIFSRNQSEQLGGSNIDDFVLDSISNEVGAIPHSIQRMGYVFCFDDRGIVQTRASDTYGNFAQGTVSKKIQPIINQMRQIFVASSVHRSENQYRIYGSDGSGICMTSVGDKYHFGFFDYPDNVACAVSGEDTTGKDVVYFGTDDGWVMQADKGSSFDGEDIESFIMLPFNNSKTPTTLKTYRKATIELTCESYAAFKFSSELSYGDAKIPANIIAELTELGPGGIWDIDNWSEFFYDQTVIASPSIRINGTGLNVSLTIYSNSSIDLGHKLDGIIMHYTPRRLQR